jgi:hypothetical protein
MQRQESGVSDDALLTGADREEAMARVYVHAVAAAAGYVVGLMDFDRDGVDVQIRAGGAMRPCLDVQLKATVRLGPAVDGTFRYPLKRRNYDLLRLPSLVPRVLVVLGLPRDPLRWLDVTRHRLVLRRCAWWANLSALPDTSNRESVTVPVSESNPFDVDGLRMLMERCRLGTIA